MNCTCKEKNNYCVNDCETIETSENIGFDDWVSDMEEQEQPDACNVQDEDCENCGS